MVVATRFRKGVIASVALPTSPGGIARPRVAAVEAFLPEAVSWTMCCTGPRSGEVTKLNEKLGEQIKEPGEQKETK